MGHHQPGKELTFKEKQMTGKRKVLNKVDPVTFEVLRHRIWAINDEQALVAARVSGSPVVYETFDFNLGILTPEGKGVYTGVYIAHHAIPLEQVVRAVRKKFGDDINPGDMFYTNDPWCGALHANDGALASPVFWKGEIVCWTAIVMHDVDVGGPVAGSFVVGAHECLGEAPLYPPIRLVKNDEIEEDFYEVLKRNCRSPEVNYLNMKARISSQLMARQRLHDLITEYGRDTFVNILQEIINHTKVVLEDRLSRIPDGTWYEHGYLDHDGITDKIYKIVLKLTKKGSKLVFDFTGTDPQAAGSVNCTIAGLSGGVLAPIMSMLCYDLPWSTGALNEIVEIKAEEGTVNNAKFPAAVSMASIQGAFATQNVASNAVAKMLCCSSLYKEEAQACWAPYWNGPGTSGWNQRGEYFVQAMAEGGGGGGGARTFRDGIDCGGMIHSLCAAIPNVETNEYMQPVIELYRRYCPDTCGHGRWRGGSGLEYAYTPVGVDKPINIRMVVCGVTLPGSQGLFGGYPPSINTNVLLRNTNIDRLLKAGTIPSSIEELESSEREILPAKILTQLFPGDVHTGIACGGSGYADPLKREPELVYRDIEQGMITLKTANDIYGVALNGKGINRQKTAQLRQKILTERKKNSRQPLKKINKTAEAAVADVKNLKTEYPVSDYMEVRSAAGSKKKYIYCRTCNRPLCPENASLREYLARSRPLPLGNFSNVNRLCPDPSAFLIEYYCPSCGTLLSTDIVLKEEAQTVWPEFDMS